MWSMCPVAMRQVFKRPPQGCRKIVLATNIAETSITIDDVAFVVDSCRVKEKTYDPYLKMCMLSATWISKASARQRKGASLTPQPYGSHPQIETLPYNIGDLSRERHRQV